ncbi:[citrate (pro-3S)-lyase] ligase [Formivibrio citricus]|uniref:[Citrate [pro-3S]-lyase] ligase n=1 Tax=Formivibrio citricus TaxID=83765 RepID=A0A1I5AEI3_9NEIS|nr:[citrate (pro-3S)-lyase] ligase [Formivibrio citricus]SFN60891.1 [citrate (pro-3S)-lyase] ligase [Formivibrio citricus]
MNDYEFRCIDPRFDLNEREQIRALLSGYELGFDEGIQTFVIAAEQGQVKACAGLDGNVVKCVALAPEFRGESVSLKLMTEVVNVAYERGHTHLFLYTHPKNKLFFQGCGFYPLVEVPDYVTLLESTPFGIRRYCEELQQLRQPGSKIGCIVMNANPFTLGHQYLVRTAAAQCDWLHVFLVREDASQFPFRERFALVEAGIAGIPKVTLHKGSKYMISRATFPDYFFKEKGKVGACFTGIDLLLFREYIAPALGVTHRFVGSEPFCETTCQYNLDMRHWLQDAPSRSPALEVVELPRTEAGGRAISASEVRRALQAGDVARLRQLVPEATLALLCKNYGLN